MVGTGRQASTVAKTVWWLRLCLSDALGYQRVSRDLVMSTKRRDERASCWDAKKPICVVWEEDADEEEKSNGLDDSRYPAIYQLLPSSDRN